MGRRLTADVVNALVDPVVDVIESFMGIEAQPAGIRMTERIDPPPSLVCTVEMSGRLVGPITWVFSEELARLFATRVLAIDALQALENGICFDAVTELANIITGNATGKLMDAGYDVEINPPRIHGGTGPERQLEQQTLAVWLDTSVGRIKILIGVNVSEDL